MKKALKISILALLISTKIFAILPDEDVKNYKNINKELFKPLTENDLKEIIDRIHKIYGDVIQKNYNAKLVFNANWEDNTVNSFATRPDEKIFQINIPGGMVRAKGMTKDSLALVLCHELGHHIGGAPRTTLYNGWPSAEGQSDYFATSKCLKRYFYELRTENVDIASNIPEKVIQDCNKVYTDFTEMKICVRSILASIEFANFINQLPTTKIPIKLETPDPKVVRGTNINDYPRPQCRFDTLYQGALCKIPGTELNSQTDLAQNTCMDDTELGARPKCWFAK